MLSKETVPGRETARARKPRTAQRKQPPSRTIGDPTATPVVIHHLLKFVHNRGAHNPTTQITLEMANPSRPDPSEPFQRIGPSGLAKCGQSQETPAFPIQLCLHI
jgi:hypothetical protein